MAWGEAAWEVIGHIFDAAFWTYDSHLTFQGWLALLGIGSVIASMVLFFMGKPELAFIFLGVGLAFLLTAWIVDRRDERHPYA